MKYAFFDVDNTIYNGYTASEMIFFLTENNIINQKAHDKYRIIVRDYIARKINYERISQLTLDLVSHSIKGLSIKEVENLSKQMLKSKIDPEFNRGEDPRLFSDSAILKDWVMPVLSYLNENNYKLILISAGPDFIVNIISEMFEFDEFYATEIPIKNGKYTGETTKLMNGSIKREVISKISEDSKFSIGFGDSVGDIPLLENVDLPFVVSNDHHSEMLDHAQTKGWKIFWKAEQVIDLLEKKSN